MTSPLTSPYFHQLSSALSHAPKQLSSCCAASTCKLQARLIDEKDTLAFWLVETHHVCRLDVRAAANVLVLLASALESFINFSRHVGAACGGRAEGTKAACPEDSGFGRTGRQPGSGLFREPRTCSEAQKNMDMQSMVWHSPWRCIRGQSLNSPAHGLDAALRDVLFTRARFGCCFLILSCRGA